MELDTIYSGDACELLAKWPPGSVDLAFADPPFNIGYVYDGYNDDVPNADYIAWSRTWMAACKRVLKADGSFYIAIGDDFAADLRIIARKLGLHLRNWIIWRYTFGQNMKAKFCRAHTHIFYSRSTRADSRSMTACCGRPAPGTLNTRICGRARSDGCPMTCGTNSRACAARSRSAPAFTAARCPKRC